MSKSMKANGDKQYARESRSIRDQTIYKILAALEVLVYGAE